MTDVPLLTVATVGAYLEAVGLVPSGVPVAAEELGGGISNVVLKVSWGEEAMVLKQSMPKLRVSADWPFDRRRTLVERDCLQLLGRLVPGAVPDVIFCDADEYVLAISCVPDGGTLWKQALMAGDVDDVAAGRAGALLGRIHRLSALDADARDRFADQTVMIQGRTNPYHLTAAARHPSLAPAIEREVARLLSTRVALTLGDYSPKNLFVYDDRVVAIDFEVAHWGDPAFDVAFCLTHLVLKAMRFETRSARYLAAAARFWADYAAEGGGLAQEPDVVCELGCLLLARIDGKSPIEYITADPTRNRVRALAASLITGGDGSVAAALGLAQTQSEAGAPVASRSGAWT
ncbi:MAG TPA: phosphotransferase [Solirubrobacteraceae bacterium]